MLPRRSIALLLVMLLGRFAPLQAQDASDIIRGQVLGPDKKPVENVTVTATSLVNQTSRNAKTNKDGRFTIIFNGGGGDYMMAYVAIGFQPTRFEVKREVDEDVLIADATISKTAVALDAIRVTAGRERPDRNGAPEVGGREQGINTSNVPIDILGDLSAMAATLPGITLIPGADGGAAGFSVLGLGADQNNITLNGLNFSGTDLPRDATSQTRVTTSSFDPSRGGFSGGQIALRTNSGSNYVTRSLHQTVDAPTLQYTDAIGRSLGQQFTNLQLSGSASGPDPARQGLLFVLVAARTTLEQPSGFAQHRSARARARRRIVGLRGPPHHDAEHGRHSADVECDPDRQAESQNGSFITSFDFSPSGTHNFNITANGRWSGQDATNLSTTAVPVHGGETRSYGGTLQARHSSYFKESFLNETSGSIQESVSSGDPYIDLPSATVRVNSTFADGTAGVSNLQFGGNTGLPRNSRTFTSELQNQISWISLDNKHRYKFGVDLPLQPLLAGQHDESARNVRLQLARGFPERCAGELHAASPGRTADSATTLARRRGWVTRIVARSGFSSRTDCASTRRTSRAIRRYNAVVDSIFGARNDAVPRGVYVSPRLGFSWTYGTNPQIGGFEGAQRGSRGQISGGIGQFQNLPNSQLIAAAVDQTGLPSAAQQLSCIGSAVPVADWLDYLQSTGSIPTTCAGDVTNFSSTVPNVSLFAPDYIPQRSWRGDPQLEHAGAHNRFRLSSGATYSLNLNQQSQIDLNFNRKALFTLPLEGRPVFVNSASIFPATGSILSRDARITQTYAQVTDYLSDLQSHSTQLSFGVSPIAFNSALQWNADVRLAEGGRSDARLRRRHDGE